MLIKNACVPINHKTENVTSSHEEVKQILTITKCGCNPE